MITKSKQLSAVLILALGLTVGIQTIAPAAPMGTAFTFQGRFTDANSPANGEYDFEWKLFDDPNAGTQLGSTIYSDNLDVNDGDFTAVLDFGSGIFDGNACWLEIGARPGDSNDAYTTLDPRRELTPIPYAIYADNSNGGSGTTNYIAKFTDSNGITDSAIYESSGNIGIGTSSPQEVLHVYGSGNKALEIESTSTGSNYAGVKITGGGNSWGLFIGTDGHSFLAGEFGIYDWDGESYRMVIDSSGNIGIGTTSPAGKLDVNGSIYQRGGLLHSDYVFEPGYELESVDEHSQFMWQNRHLKAIPKAEIDAEGQEVVELGAHRRGMVEELEKAHIYIEQLHNRIKALEERLAKLETGDGTTE